jgi:nucleoid-associated protein YgaU
LDVIPRESGVNGRSIYGLREHKIEEGDSLEQMAARYLGDPARADEIFELNQNILTNKEELPIGLILRIPDRE